MGYMKNYKQFVNKMSTSSIVYTVENTTIPSYESDIIIKTAQKLSESKHCGCIVFVCNEESVSLDSKINYFQLLYPSINFVKSYDLQESITSLNNTYDNVITHSTQLIESNNKSDKMLLCVEQGNYNNFKHYLPIGMRDIDGRRLFNEIRQHLNLDVIKENIKINIDSLRDKYYKKEIFNIGDTVESNNQLFEIVDRGSNYLSVINENGIISRKWIQDVTMSEQQLFTNAQFQPDNNFDSVEITFKGYTTTNLHNAPGSAKAFQKTINNVGNVDPVSVLNALKATDTYLGMTPEMILQGGSEDRKDLLAWSTAHLKAKQALDMHGEFINHADYWHTYKDKLDKAVFAVKIKSDTDPIQESNMEDKLKVAKSIAKVAKSDCNEECPESIVNNALKKVKSLNKESVVIINKLLQLAEEVGIKYDTKIVKYGLTNQQYKLAEERATRYGRRYPNPIDNAWALKNNKANSSKPTIADEDELAKMNTKGVNVSLDGLDPKYKQDIENYANTGHVNPTTKPHGVDQPEYTHIGSNLTVDGDDTLARMKAKKMMNVNEAACCEHEKEESDEELDKMINSLSDDDYLHAYDPDELHVIDSETGEKIQEKKPVNEELLNEVLSKMERIKAKLRMAKNASKIGVKRMLALVKHSSSKVINKRARHMAVHLIRKKILKGRDYDTLSTSERERIDKIVEQRAKVIARLAMRLAPKIRKIEQTRLSHKQFTKED